MLLSSRSLMVACAVLLCSCAGRSVIGPRNPLTDHRASGVHRSLLDPAQFAVWRRAYEHNEGTLVDPVVRNDAQGRSIAIEINAAPDLAAAKVYRNKILKQLLVIDDDYFTLWSQKLYGTRVIASGLADLAEGVMAAFVSASGAASQKSLGLALAGLTSGRLAAQKNIFLEQSAAALISTMEEDRSKVRAQMIQYMRQPVDEYSLDDGLSDVVRYYEAGTLASASASLQAIASTRERQASALVEQIKGDTRVAPAELNRGALPEFSSTSLPPKTPRKDPSHTAESGDQTNHTDEGTRLIGAINTAIASPNVSATELTAIAAAANLSAPSFSEPPTADELSDAKTMVANAITNIVDEDLLHRIKAVSDTAAASAD